MAYIVEKIDLKIFLEKKFFFWDLVVFRSRLGSKKSEKFFFYFQTPNGSIRPENGFRKKSETFCQKTPNFGGL